MNRAFENKTISGLNFMPLRYPLTDEDPWRTNGIRKMPVKNFLVYYLIDEESKTVSLPLHRSPASQWALHLGMFL